MKNVTNLIKTLALCLTLVMMAGGAKGQVKTIINGNPTITLTSGTITYGTASSAIYSIRIPTNNDNNVGTVTFTIGGTLPSNVTITPNPISFDLAKNSTTTTSSFTLTTTAVTSPAGTFSNLYLTTGTTPSIYTSNNFTLTITPKALTVSGVNTADKIYDGTTTAIVTGGTLNGVINSDVVTFTPSGTFATKEIGANKPITSTSTIGGTNGGNYTLSQPALTARSITAKSLSVTSPSVTSKSYDRTSAATITGTLSGKIATDAVTLNGTGTFASVNAANGISVTSTSTLSGTDAGNYTLTQPTGLTGNITAKTLTVNGAMVNSKVFDGTTAATITGTLPGVISPDVVTLNGTGTFASVNVANGISVTSTSTLSGADAGNYTLTQPTGLTGDITKPTTVSWNGTTSTAWATSNNWTPPYLPDATIDVTIPNVTNKPSINASTVAACNNLTINASAGLTIQPTGSLTVTNNLTNASANDLSLLSDATGTGSLIINGTTTSSATVKRYMTSGAWHLVSAPVTGQLIKDFLGANGTIPTLISDATTKAMREYISIGNVWGEFYTTGNTDPLDAGKGYCMRVMKNVTPHEVVFTGTLQAGTKTISGLSAGNWNCIGNPYTSAIGITASATTSDNFLNVNAVTNSNIDPAYGIYIWDNQDILNGQTGKYTAISNALNVKNLHYLQQGQAFMVKMLTSSVSFTKAMQLHDVALTLKSTEDIWPTIQLITTADSTESSTVIAFHEGMTNGLDPTYDAGLLASGGSMELYTRLVDDYGIPFAIQALPSDAYDQLVIPVGVDYSKGGAVSFSAKGVYLPSSCRPLLEDRLTGIITDLSNQTYTTDLTANTAGTGRFYLHTSYSTTGAASRDKASLLSAWAVGNHEITINGKINNGAVASLYDLQGRLIVTRVLREGISDHISLPAVNRGIYLLQVRDSQTIQALKVTIGQ